MKHPNTLNEILQHALNGGKFEYQSYRHEQAEKEWRDSDGFKKEWPDNGIDLLPKKIDKYYIPEDIRQKHAYWRPGKLRSVEFGPDGTIRRCYIGAKRAITIYEMDLHKVSLV